MDKSLLPVPEGHSGLAGGETTGTERRQIAPDGSHFARVMDLLFNECENFNQVIITTHSQQWRDRYDGEQIPQGKSCLIELQGWSHQSGIVAKPSASV